MWGVPLTRGPTRTGSCTWWGGSAFARLLQATLGCALLLLSHSATGTQERRWAPGFCTALDRMRPLYQLLAGRMGTAACQMIEPMPLVLVKHPLPIPSLARTTPVSEQPEVQIR